MMRMPWLGLWMLSALAVVAPAHAARDELRRIVQHQCLPHWLQQHDAAPCLRVWVPASGVQDGYALLADRKGGAHLLLIPLRRLDGIESPELLQPGMPRYFAAAWQAREQLAARAAHALAFDAVALAINSRYSRTQDQLHIHIECQGAALHTALMQQAEQLNEQWVPLRVGGNTYYARSVKGAALERAEPFALLNQGIPAARGHMGRYTLVLAGLRLPDGPGFALLERRAALHGGESLLDSSCAVAGR
jgi:CDP-diacylglycerol pyrophosphatase